MVDGVKTFLAGVCSLWTLHAATLADFIAALTRPITSRPLETDNGVRRLQE